MLLKRGEVWGVRFLLLWDCELAGTAAVERAERDGVPGDSGPALHITAALLEVSTQREVSFRSPHPVPAGAGFPLPGSVKINVSSLKHLALLGKSHAVHSGLAKRLNSY